MLSFVEWTHTGADIDCLNDVEGETKATGCERVRMQKTNQFLSHQWPKPNKFDYQFSDNVGCFSPPWHGEKI